MLPVIIFFRNHSISLAVVVENSVLHLPSRIDSFKLSFFPRARAIRLWNHLPDHIVKPDVNIDSFKHLVLTSS